MRILLFPILLIFTPCFNEAKETSEVVHIKWHEYTFNDLQNDLSTLLNRSAGGFMNVVFKRYPDVLTVLRSVLNHTANSNGTLSTWQLCSTVESVFNQSRDACNVPRWAMENEMIKVCDDINRNSSTIEMGLGDICEKPSHVIFNKSAFVVPKIYPTRNTHMQFTRPFGNFTQTNISFIAEMLPSNTFFLAIKVLTGTVSEAYKRKCLEYGGNFNKATRLCTKNSTVLNLAKDDIGLKIISIVGNIISFVSCVILVACYVLFKKFSTLPGKNTIALSSSLALVHFIQFVLIFSSKKPWVCRAGATLLHWALLLSFAWMAILAYEFFITFTKLRVSDKNRVEKRFKRYICVACSLATVIVFICLMIDIPKERYIGYGVKGVCFVAGFWADMFAFIVPVWLVLLCNIVLLTLTIIKLKAIKETTERSLTSGNSQTKRKKVILSLLTIKLSILFGLGWVFAFIDSAYYSIVLRYMYTILIACQGLLVFICFGCHKESWNAVSEKICQRKKLPLNFTSHTQQTRV